MTVKYSRRTIARVVAAKIFSESSDSRRRLLKALAAYMVEHKMTEDADLVVNDIAREYFNQSGHLLVDVTSARPLNDTNRAELKRALQEITDAKRVTLSEHIDRKLLGGLVARTPDGQLDNSVRSRVEQLAAIT